MLNSVRGLICLVLFYGAGEAIVLLTRIPVPGAVIGMLLLFFALRISKQATPSWLQNSSQLLIRLLSLFFLPAAVGLFFLPPGFENQWPAIFGAIVIATLLSLSVTGLLLNKLLKPANNPSADKP